MVAEIEPAFGGLQVGAVGWRERFHGRSMAVERTEAKGGVSRHQGSQAARKRHEAVLPTFCLPEDEPRVGQVEVVDSRVERFGDTQAAGVEEID